MFVLQRNESNTGWVAIGEVHDREFGPLLQGDAYPGTGGKMQTPTPRRMVSLGAQGLRLKNVKYVNAAGVEERADLKFSCHIKLHNFKTPEEVREADNKRKNGASERQAKAGVDKIVTQGLAKGKSLEQLTQEVGAAYRKQDENSSEPTTNKPVKK